MEKHHVTFHQDGKTATCSCEQWRYDKDDNRKTMIEEHEKHKNKPLTGNMETYTQQKQRHSDEFSNMPGLFFAFSNQQLHEGLEKIGLAPCQESYPLITSIGAGGYLLKEKIKDFEALLDRHAAERAALRKDRKELLAALIYELNNHEYCYTGDPTDALAALDLTRETVPADILKEAIKQCHKKD